MSVKIRLTRHGAKKRPFYRIIVSDSRSPRDGRFIEQLGTYDPKAENGVRLNRDKVDSWIKRGARPSQTVADLLKRERKRA